MYQSIWIIVALPLIAFAVTALAGSVLSRRQIAWIGAVPVALAAIFMAVVLGNFLAHPPTGPVVITLWRWIASPPLQVDLAFRLDALSLVMTTVVTWVAALILIYSTKYMQGEDGYSRYFAFMNLFVASMLILVLANDLLVLFLGWEGVGLCSYLLIGFWYRDLANINAARKAFIMTRIGDAAFLVGMLLLFNRLGTLRIDAIVSAAATGAMAPWVPAVAGVLLLAGAVGKSAQIPLQTWLPDAMAGPTPVSALIHAATMVTAGVYLIARMNGLFAASAGVMRLVAIIGAATILVAALSACTERDIKRVLAYSTISQIGFMFLALGVGAWTAAIFHFITHAFFKSLLFLSAGVVIHNLGGERDLFRMGGIYKRMPVTCTTFTIAACSLSALPLVTAGFYSKDLILFSARTSLLGSGWLWFCGIAGAFLTAFYTFRMLILTFFGTAKHEAESEHSALLLAPLVPLAVAAIATGWLQTPPHLGSINFLANLLGPVLPAARLGSAAGEWQVRLQLVAAAASLSGIFLAWETYVRRPSVPGRFARVPGAASVIGYLQQGFAIDRLYDFVAVRPFARIAAVNREDFLLYYSTIIGRLAEAAHAGLKLSQNGRIRWYAAGIATGTAIICALGLFT